MIMISRQTRIIIAVYLLLTSCSAGSKVVSRYYLLEKPDNFYYQDDETSIASDKYCEIMQVEVYPAFSSQKIANRSDSKELIYYTSHFWAQRPELSFTLLVKDYFSHAPVFKGVSTRYWRLNPEFELYTTIYQLEIIEEGKEAKAHLSLEFMLLDKNRNEIIAEHKADRKEILEKKDLNLFSIAISKLFYDELRIFSEKIISKPME